ncbi:hypothetical protein M011DRAFT_459327 [Sporormia fimetaria CBS 119925]|uniref:Uncharacterized protein n=1 Tax=Sporormia fimetaria CBS 119925 TaxID=1340428 RepID=A0A6A6V919_9PLEO|nr:hypothetical protein M011DRAFT_459327 [Sporormia fimetaria CBS 119925]
MHLLTSVAFTFVALAGASVARDRRQVEPPEPKLANSDQQYGVLKVCKEFNFNDCIGIDVTHNVGQCQKLPMGAGDDIRAAMPPTALPFGMPLIAPGTPLIAMPLMGAGFKCALYKNVASCEKGPGGLNTGIDFLPVWQELNDIEFPYCCSNDPGYKKTEESRAKYWYGEAAYWKCEAKERGELASNGFPYCWTQSCEIATAR